eukprot:1162129-Pelagomonas_calceolata.AAC.6
MCLPTPSLPLTTFEWKGKQQQQQQQQQQQGVCLLPACTSPSCRGSQSANAAVLLLHHRSTFGCPLAPTLPGAHECIGGHTSGQQAAPEIWILPQEAEHVGSL